MDTVVARMTPEMRLQWIAELSVLGVDQAADVVRSLIPRSSPKPPPAVPAPAGPIASSSTQVAAAREDPTCGGATSSTLAITSAAPASTATVTPTPAQWAHLLAIRSRLSPQEAAIAEAVVARMTPKARAQWLAELSVLGLDEAAEVVRSQIPKPPPKPRAAGSSATDDDKS